VARRGDRRPAPGPNGQAGAVRPVEGGDAGPQVRGRRRTRLLPVPPRVAAAPPRAGGKSRGPSGPARPSPEAPGSSLPVEALASILASRPGESPRTRPRARRSGSSRRETRQFGTALTSRSRSAGPADRPIRPPIAIPKPTAEAANAPDARGVDSPSDGTARLRVGRLSLPWPRTGRTTRGRRPPCRTAGNPR